MSQKEYAKTVLDCLLTDGYSFSEYAEEVCRPGTDYENLFFLQKHEVDFLILTYAVDQTGMELSDAEAEAAVQKLKNVPAHGSQRILITNGCLSDGEKRNLRKESVFVMDASKQKFPWNGCAYACNGEKSAGQKSCVSFSFSYFRNPYNCSTMPATVRISRKMNP